MAAPLSSVFGLEPPSCCRKVSLFQSNKIYHCHPKEGRLYGRPPLVPSDGRSRFQVDAQGWESFTPTGPSNNPDWTSLTGSLRIRYARKRKRIFFICFVLVAIGLTTVGFLMGWPSDAESSSQQRTLPVLIDSGRTNDTGFGKERTQNLKNTAAEPVYLLNSTNCRIQDFPPFHDDVIPYVSNQTLESCTKLPLLSSVSVNANGTHTLHLHKDNIPLYIQGRGTEMFCCYSIMSIDYESADLNSDSMESSECQKLTGDVLLNQSVEYVQVTCHILQTTAFYDNESVDLYKNVHAFVGMKPQVLAKMDRFRQMSPFHEEKQENVTHDTTPYSIMIFGIDSMSRLNFLRTMPKTAKYLENNGWFPLKVYNKAGENTLPNLAAAVLAGIQLENLNSTCWSDETAAIDDCPWIFKKFSEKGYITAYGEDTPQWDTLSTLKFSKPPTDYFLRPFMRAAERLSSSSWYEKFLKFFDCLGPVHGVDHVLNYSAEFAKTFENYPTFSLFWLNTFSHNCLNCPAAWDEKIVEYFKNLESIRRNTIGIFMSDHGQGEGGFRQTNMGFFESNLPFIYFSAPERFARSKPEKLENLIENEYKLTSPFDVHLTLLDLLGEGKFAAGCPKCFSLFEKLPQNRSCADAGIPERYCACTEYDIVSNTTPYKFVADFVVQELNALRKSYEKYVRRGRRCAEFSLKGTKPIKIAVSPLSGYQSILRSFKNAFSAESHDHELFVVTVETKPRAIFEATVSQNNNGTLKIVNTISRIDQYEKSSKCMEYPDGKKYCFCESKQIEF